MFSRFFVRRPVFAWVIAILIMLAGVLAIRTLPVGQYPDVAPPAVKISATYTGASAETLENSVTQVIEQQLTGLDHLLYFSSTSSSDGSVSITVTFEQGTDPDTAQVQVQNKVQQAESRLPSEVQQSGVTVEKSQSSFLLILAVYDSAMSEPFPKDWLKKAEDLLQVETEEQWNDHPVVQWVLTNCRYMAEALDQEVDSLLDLCDEPGGPYMYRPCMEGLKDILSSLMQARTCGEWQDVAAGISFGRLSSKKDEDV